MKTETVDVGADQLRTATWTGTADGASTIVMLHDGLGSISQWRDLPARIHLQTGATVIAYERAGHGASTPVPVGPWPADWLHREAVVLGELLEVIGLDDPLLVGHSDGGSIALIHAATGGRCRALAALASHSWVEPICTDSIRAMRADSRRWIDRLARSHDEPAAVFEAWSGVWVGDEFASWDIRPLIADIDCPVLVVQGTEDEYATDAQLTETAAAIGANATTRVVDGVGHVMHHQAPATVVDLIATFHSEHTIDVQAGA